MRMLSPTGCQHTKRKKHSWTADVNVNHSALPPIHYDSAEDFKISIPILPDEYNLESAIYEGRTWLKSTACVI